MVSTPLHTMSLTEYLLRVEQFNLSQNIQELVRSLLNPTFVVDTGHMLLFISTCILVPSTLGYVGAVRESRVLLFMVGKVLGYFIYHRILVLQYFAPVLLLWVLELVFLILFPVFKSLLYSWTVVVGKYSLGHYRGRRRNST